MIGTHVNLLIYAVLQSTAPVTRRIGNVHIKHQNGNKMISDVINLLMA